MADPGYIESQLGGMEPDIKKNLMSAFRYLLGNLTLGPVEHQRRATNLQAYFLNSTTPASANEEFSVAHGLGSTPNLIWPVAALNQVGAQIVPLQIARAADDKRIYLRSSSTSAVFTVLVG